MNIEYVNGLLHAKMSITYQGQTTTIDRLVIDTGAWKTLLSADVVFDLGIFATPDDDLTVMSGIGGEDFAFRKVVDCVVFGSLEMERFPLDFGDLDEGFGINGIIGLDILLKGQFVIDLEEMKILQRL